MMEDKIEEEETNLDRLRNYRKLVAGGKSDKEAIELVWPSTTVGKNAKDKVDKDKADLEKAESEKED